MHVIIIIIIIIIIKNICLHLNHYHKYWSYIGAN